MARPKKKPPEKVVRRPREERKGLSPEFESLARGETDRLFRPRRSDPDRVRDPREGYAIKGVANRDARAVYEARIRRLHGLFADETAARAASRVELAEELCDWLRLSLWQARRVTGLRSFAEDVLGQPEAEVLALAREGAARLGVLPESVSERAVALWLRLEAGLLEADPQARVRLSASGRFDLRVGLDAAPAGVAAASVRVSPLVHDRRVASGGGPAGGRRERSGRPGGPSQGAPPDGRREQRSGRPGGPSQGAPPDGRRERSGRPGGPSQGAPPDGRRERSGRPGGPPQGAPPDGARPVRRRPRESEEGSGAFGERNHRPERKAKAGRGKNQGHSDHSRAAGGGSSTGGRDGNRSPGRSGGFGPRRPRKGGDKR